MIDPMSWFNIGYQSSPTASMGQTIRGVLDAHSKLNVAAGAKAFEAMMPKEQAQAQYYQTMADQAAGEAAPQEGPPEVTEVSGQKFYKKPVYNRGIKKGSQWAPINQNMWSMFGPSLGTTAGSTTSMTGSIAKPAQVDESDWARANDETKQALVAMFQGR